MLLLNIHFWRFSFLFQRVMTCLDLLSLHYLCFFCWLNWSICKFAHNIINLYCLFVLKLYSKIYIYIYNYFMIIKSLIVWPTHLTDIPFIFHHKDVCSCVPKLQIKIYYFLNLELLIQSFRPGKNANEWLKFY